MKASVDKIALGINDDEVPLGSYLIHFWHNDSEFERGVRFLELGVDDESQYCVLFGHDEANDRVLQILRKTGRDLDRVIREGRLVILRREALTAVTNNGSACLRLLANYNLNPEVLQRALEEIVADGTRTNRQ